MDKQRLVLNTLVLQAEQERGVTQPELVRQLLSLNVQQIELRREYQSGQLAELRALNDLRLRHRLVYFYSIPDDLFVDGQVNPQLIQYVAEAAAMGASYLKMTLGDFENTTDFTADQVLRWLPENMHLNIENDQTVANTDPDKLTAFFQTFTASPNKVGFVNDLGNWVFTQRDTFAMTRKLLPFTRFVHLKNYRLDAHQVPQTVAFDQGELNIEELLHQFSPELPVALEYPTTLTALQHDIATLTSKEDVD